MVHAGGRPPIYDIEEEANALEEWSKKSDSFNLLGFANIRDYAPEYLSVWEKQSDKFSQALKKAKSRIGERREQLVHSGEYNYGVYNRAQHMYDINLRNAEREEKVFEYDLRKQLAEFEAKLRSADGLVDENLSTQFDALMNQVSSLQTSLKKSSKSKSTDSKS